MKTYFILFVSLIFIQQVAQADQASDLQRYLDFATKWTSYEYNGEELPKVEVVDHTLVQIYAYGDYVYAQAEHKGQKLNEVLSVYDRDRKTIYLSEKLEDDSSLKSVTMIHETVHYLQDISGYTASLDGHLECTESEAYDVQVLWQIQNQIDVENISFVQERSLFSAMQCMGDQSGVFN